MRTSNTDVALVVWNTMFCCRTVAGIVLEDFHPAQNAASHHKWAEMQRLLKFFRGAIMSDAYRLQPAVELEVVTLPVGSSSSGTLDGSYFVDDRQCSPTKVVGRECVGCCTYATSADLSGVEFRSFFARVAATAHGQWADG